MRKFISKLMPVALIAAASCLALASCGGDDNDNDKDEPEAPAVWSTVYEISFEIGDDVFRSADVTAHIAHPDGTFSQEPVTRQDVSWTLKGDKLPDKAGVLLTFAPKDGFDQSRVYDVEYKGSITAAAYRDGKQQSFKTYPREIEISIPGANLADYYAKRSFGFAFSIDSDARITNETVADFDFGL